MTLTTIGLSWDDQEALLRRIGIEAWAGVRSREIMDLGGGGLFLLADAAGIRREEIIREAAEDLLGSSVSRRWVPVGYALVETHADLAFRISHWFAVPGAFFDGTATELHHATAKKGFAQRRLLRKVQFMGAPDGRVFRWYRSRIDELDVRDELLGVTAGARGSGHGGIAAPRVRLLGSPQEGVEQLSAWNEEANGEPAGPYGACTHALGSGGVWGHLFDWLPLETYEALLAAAPPRTELAIGDNGAYREYACPHPRHDSMGSTRRHARAKPVDLRSGMKAI